jgi:predicted AAA+ superfamily ATPase
MKSNNYRRFLQQTNESYFLFGPRGTGKTTWLKMNYPDALYIDLLSTNAYISYTASPERIKELVYGNPDKKTIIIDEVQRVPGILTIVHQIIEEKRGIQFILTGSSSRKLKRTGVDLLAGRALLKKCYPFIACELAEEFNLQIAIVNGMIPLVVSSENSTDVLDAYISLYLREEIQNEGLVRNIGNFARFLEAISFSHSCVLNLSDVSRECEVERKSVEGFLNILEDLMLCYRIPVFNKRAKRILISHNKFYFFDSGVFHSIRPKGILDKVSEISGQSAEGLVLQHLMAWNDYSGNHNKIFYWRTKSGVEVDFIVYGGTEFCAIEVKNSEKIDNRELKGLHAFKEDYPEAKLLFLYRGKEKLQKGNVLCLPLDMFLLQLVPGNNLYN